MFQHGKYFEQLSSSVQNIVNQITNGNDEVSSLLKALVLEVTEGRNDIADKVQLLITQTNDHQRGITDRLTSQHTEVIDGMENVSLRINEAETRISSLVSKAVSKSQLDDAVSVLLKSLECEGMLEREANIMSSDLAVFEDAFHGAGIPELIFQNVSASADTSNDERPRLEHGNEGDTSQQPEESVSQDKLCSCGLYFGFEDVFYRNSSSKRLALSKMVEFYAWLMEKNGAYWISGLPGSGKSTLLKYLINRPETRRALQVWAGSRTLHLASFFVWELGRVAEQKNLKGMLCSLLYQILDSDRNAAAKIFTHNPEIGCRRTFRDWDPTFVERMLVKYLTSSQSYFCLFIDGLDELSSEQEMRKIVFFIKSLEKVENVKFCISSRPEELFKVYLGDKPSLNLHELTKKSMYNFVEQNLHPNADNSDTPWCECQRNKIVHAMVQRCDGVFLWLGIVIGNINRGAIRGDTTEELQSRLELLPKGIDALYSSMWKRLGDDGAIYGQSAAEYINLLLAQSDIFERFSTGGKHSPATLMVLLAAKDNLFRDGTILPGNITSRLGGVGWCKRRIREINTRCGGLLQVRDHSQSYEHIYLRRDGVDPDLREALLTNVSFVHRSAFEFFINTDLGREIRQHDSTSIVNRYHRMSRAAELECFLRVRICTHRSRFSANFPGRTELCTIGLSLALNSLPQGSAVPSEIGETLTRLYENPDNKHFDFDIDTAMVSYPLLFNWLLTTFTWKTGAENAARTFCRIWSMEFYVSVKKRERSVYVTIVRRMLAIGVSLKTRRRLDTSIRTLNKETLVHYLSQSPVAQLVSYMYVVSHNVLFAGTHTDIYKASEMDLLEHLLECLCLVLESDPAGLNMGEIVSCYVNIKLAPDPRRIRLVCEHNRYGGGWVCIPGGCNTWSAILEADVAWFCSSLLSMDIWPTKTQKSLQSARCGLERHRMFEGSMISPRIPLVLARKPPMVEEYTWIGYDFAAELSQPDSDLLLSCLLPHITTVPGKYGDSSLSCEDVITCLESLKDQFSPIDETSQMRYLNLHVGHVSEDDQNKLNAIPAPENECIFFRRDSESIPEYHRCVME